MVRKSHCIKIEKFKIKYKRIHEWLNFLGKIVRNNFQKCDAMTAGCKPHTQKRVKVVQKYELTPNEHRLTGI